MARRSNADYLPILGYSTNVHPGENLRQVYRFLQDYTIPVKKRVFGEKPAGLELRLGIGSTRDLQDASVRRKFGAYLEDAGLMLFSINAFPLQDWHARRVKERVYKPSWAEADRARWTNAIAKVFGDLLPEGITGSISTLGGAYRGEGHDARTFRKLAANYLKTVRCLLDLERRGKPMVLAVEPEPATTFETARDVIDFFENNLLPLAFERWRTHGPKARIEADVRRIFTVNVDTCHFSTLFEDQVGSQRSLEKAGLRVGKLHVTNAVTLKNPYRSPTAYRDFRDMREPRYLHQFRGIDRDEKRVWNGLDLDELPRVLKKGKHPDVVELRSHFHVPLYLKRFRRLPTTQKETVQAIREIVRHRRTRHLVLETYTWPIITGKERRREKLVNGIAREFRWLQGVLSEMGIDA